MSIDRDRFESASEEELSGASTPERVLGFLLAHREKAFEAKEIAARLDLDPATISTALSRLKDRGLVDHKATYWAVTNDEERLRSYSGYERATALFNDQFGSEDRDRWRASAPERPHPSQRAEE